ncbi:hypothetical protein [Aneurinibacillus sp. REN35]|uniref:hypothetical protein n=1 Tax=Aneurinibacillus sp. REN35 TaxID=3237286 RepID=UPI003529A7D2
MKKKWYAAMLGTGFALASMGSVFAAETAPATPTLEPAAYVAHGHGFGKGGKMPKAKLEELAKQKGITVDELKEEMHKEREAKLEELAKQKGITVDELKKKMQQEREARLAERAKEKGITVDELKKKMQEKRDAKLAEIAKEKGMTVDELKKQLPDIE